MNAMVEELANNNSQNNGLTMTNEAFWNTLEAAYNIGKEDGAAESFESGILVGMFIGGACALLGRFIGQKVIEKMEEQRRWY